MSAFSTNLKNFTLSLTQSNAGTTGATQNYVYTLNMPKKLPLYNHEVALHSAVVWNAIPNITSNYNNSTFSYIAWDGTVRTVNLLPNGTTGALLDFTGINGVLQTTMFNNNDYLIDASGNQVYYLSLSANAAYGLGDITSLKVPTSLPTGFNYPPVDGNGHAPNGLNPPAALSGTSTNMQMVIPATGIVSLLGFNAGNYPSTRVAGQGPIDTLSNNSPQIAPVTSISITCNLSSSISDQTVIPNLLAPIPITANPFNQISFTPPNLTFWKIPSQDYYNVTVVIADQNGNPITQMLQNGHFFQLDVREVQN